MAYFKRLNQPAVADATWRDFGGVLIQTVHQFFEDMISRGWRVKGSGDCVSFENEGQTAGTTGTGSGGGFHLLTTYLGGAWAFSDDRVAGGYNVVSFPYPGGLFGSWWLRLATPLGAEHYREYLFTSKFNNNPLGEWAIYLARDDSAFSAGADAHTAPLNTTDVSNHVAIAGYQRPKLVGTTSQDRGAVAISPGTGYFHWFIGDADSDYDFLWWCTRTSERSIFRMFGQLRLARTYAEQIGEEDLDPYVYISMGGSSDGSSNDCADSQSYFFRPNNPNNLEPQARLEDRLTDNQQYQEGTNGGLYTSWGYWASGNQDSAGFYSSCLPLAGSYTGSGFAPFTSNLLHADGRSLVQFNPGVARMTTEAVGGPEFFKGHIKNDLLALTLARFDDPAMLEDSVGINGASTGRRVSKGYIHLLWEDDTDYLD